MAFVWARILNFLAYVINSWRVSCVSNEESVKKQKITYTWTALSITKKWKRKMGID